MLKPIKVIHPKKGHLEASSRLPGPGESRLPRAPFEGHLRKKTYKLLVGGFNQPMNEKYAQLSNWIIFLMFGVKIKHI